MPKGELNQILLIVFFIVLPILAIISIFVPVLRIVFVVASVVAIAAMWLLSAFLFPGRLVISGIYLVLDIIMIITSLPTRTTASNGLQTMAFATETPIVTSTPAFSSMVGTMGTDVPADFYSAYDPEDSYGLEENSWDTGDTGDTGDPGDGYAAGPVTEITSPDVSREKSESEIALENFMEKWHKGIIADMVEYTPPSWQSTQTDPPQQQLFWKFAQRPLESWEQLSPPSGTDSTTARTIRIQAQVSYSGETRTYQYDAITLFENEKWYVDPESLSSGILVTEAPATPDPEITPTPEPDPTATPGPGPKTKLYYNKDGGKKYHLDPRCPSVASRFLPLKGTFTYSELNKSPYNKLQPCERCGAPTR